jgi:hypothetical protein
MNSTPSLTNAQANFIPEKFLPEDVPQVDQNAVRQSTIESGSKTASPNPSTHEVLVDQPRDTFGT